MTCYAVVVKFTHTRESFAIYGADPVCAVDRPDDVRPNNSQCIYTHKQHFGSSMFQI